MLVGRASAGRAVATIHGRIRPRACSVVKRRFAPDGLAGALVFTGARGWARELPLVAKGGGKLAIKIDGADGA